MKNLRILFTLLLTLLFVGVQADNLVCDGLTTRPSNNKCTFGDRLQWTESSSNTMQLFSLSAGDLSDYTTMKLTLSNFIDMTDEQTVGTGNKVRVLFINSAGTNILGYSTPNFATIDGGEKTIDLTSVLTAEQRASVTEIAIGGSCAKGSVMVSPSSVKLIKSDASELVCGGFVTRPSNNKVSYIQNVFAWNANNSNTMRLFSLSAGQLSAYSTLHLTTSNLWGTGSKYRVMFIAGSTTIKTITYDAAGTQEINLFSEMTDDQVASITEIVFGGSTSSLGSLVINPSDVYLVETPEILRVQKVITSSSTNTNPFEWHKTDGETVTINNNLATQNSGVIFGYANNNDEAHGYFNLSGYNKVVFDIATGGKIRILAATGEGTSYEPDQFGVAGVKPAADIDIRKCVSIKSSNNNSPRINSITFYREFDVTSTTAWALACDMEATSFSYPRYFTIGQESTVYLPFDLTAEQASEAGEFYELTSSDGSNLGFNRVSTTEAYTPYLFVPAQNHPFRNITASLKAVDNHPATFDGTTFKGTLQHISSVQGAESGTVYGFSAASGAFVKVNSSSVSIDAFRAYIVVPAGSPAPARFGIAIRNTPTGIENQAAENKAVRKYIQDGVLIMEVNGETYDAMGRRL